MKKPAKLLTLFLLVVLVLNIGNIARVIYPVKYEEYIYQYANQYEIDPYLVMGMIKTESNFDESAISNKDAKGLMQIMEPTAMWLSGRMELENFSYDDIYRPELNIKMGCYYIAYLLSMYNGNTKTALAAYNAGFGNVDKWLHDETYSKDQINLLSIPFPETRRYVTKVVNNQKVYAALYGRE